MKHSAARCRCSQARTAIRSWSMTCARRSTQVVRSTPNGSCNDRTAARCGAASARGRCMIRVAHSFASSSRSKTSPTTSVHVNRCAPARRGSRSRWKRASCRCGTGMSTRDEVYYNDQWRSSLGIEPRELLARENLSERLMLPDDDCGAGDTSSVTFMARRRRSQASIALRDAGGRIEVVPGARQGRASRRTGQAATRRWRVARHLARTASASAMRLTSSSAGSVRCAARRMACTTGTCSRATSGTRIASATSSAIAAANFPTRS